MWGLIFLGVTGDQILTKVHPLCAFSSFLPLFLIPFYLPFILPCFEWGFTAKKIRKHAWEVEKEHTYLFI